MGAREEGMIVVVLVRGEEGSSAVENPELVLASGGRHGFYICHVDATQLWQW